MKLNFNTISAEEFLKLENMAIDGQLDYDNFPPEEYKYFSRLAKIGYHNRHSGWSVEICESKQNEIKQEYISEKENAKRLLKEYKRINSDLIKASDTITQIYKAKTEYEMLEYALQALELITQEHGLAKRIKKKISDMEVTG